MKRHLSSRRGFTLVELVAAMASASILVAAMASTMFTALKASNPADTPGAVTLPALACLADMSAELQYALPGTITINPMNITVEVPDRDADALPEKIVYAWSGVDKAPLIRSYGSGDPQVVIQRVHSMTVEYTPATTPGYMTVRIHPATEHSDKSTKESQLSIVETSIALLNLQ